MNAKKRVWSAVASVLVGSAVLLSLISCGGKGSKEDRSKTDFKVLAGMSALSAGYDKSVILNEMSGKAGVSIKWETLSDSVSEQVNIRIAGNELPDAFQGIGFSNYELSEYGHDGTFIDLTKYLTDEYMPNLSKILKKHPEIKSAITMSDGKIYGLPSGEQMGTAAIGADVNHSIFAIPQFSMINKAWLDKLGLDVPQTLDELYVCLKAFKDNDMSHTYYGNAAGSTIPMSTGFDQWCWGQNIFYAGFGFTNWINDVISDLVLNDNGKVDFVSTRDKYRQAVTYFSKWYKEGLIDPAMFSMKATQLISKCSNGYVGVSTWWYIEELMGPHAADYVFLPVLKGPDGTYNVTVRTGGGTTSGNLSITKACKNPAALLKFYDLWYEPENTMQLQYGPKDVFFTGKDENGLWLSITESEAKQKYGKGAGELKSTFEVAGPKLILADYYRTTFKMEDRAIERLTDLDNYWMKFVKSDIVYPVDCVFTKNELDIIDTYKTDFENTVAEYEGKWLKNGGPTDAEWEAYKSMLKKNCGLDELTKVYQNAYDRYKKNL